MTVQVTNFNIGRSGVASPLAPNTFSDTFNRASGNLGKNWCQNHHLWSVGAAPGAGAGTASIGACSDTIQGLIWSYIGPSNPNNWCGVGLFCVPLMLSNWGVSQFSEWKLVTLTDGGLVNCVGGPSVLMQNQGQVEQPAAQANGLTGYHFEVASDGSAALRRGGAGSFTTLQTLPAASIANGDVLRLEAVVTAGTSTVLTCKKNGTQVMQQTDTPGGGMLVGGSPGQLWVQMDGTAAEVMVNQWRNFNGGRL